MRLCIVILLVCFTFFVVIANAAGRENYAPAKVVYDVSSPDPKAMGHILDRVSMLQNIYQNDPFEASIVLVIHEGAIPLFGNKDKNRYLDLMLRARSLSLGEIIDFRVCQASAKMQGYKKSDIQDFVSMVPMADAEIVQLQHQGYAYLH